MNQIEAIIVDDEKSGRENLSGVLKVECPNVKIVAEVDSVSKAIEAISESPPQLVFLDIEMPGGNGFKLLEQLQDIKFEVIFVTAFDNYAIKAIRFSAADYILKPINVIQLKEAVDKVTKRIKKKKENDLIEQLYYNLHHPQNPKIGLSINDRIEFVETKNIVRCQGESNYTHIYFSNKKPILVAKTLIEYEDLLQDNHFIRVHKTHLVNLDHIVAFERTDGGVLTLSDGSKIPVSRRRKEFVLECLKIFK